MTGRPDRDERARFDLDEWRSLGFSRERALLWFRHRIGPRDALRWQRAQVTEPIDAVRWKIAGIGPDTVREWVYAKIDAREAVAWTELGFGVVQARKHKRAGRSAVQAYGHAHRVQATSAPSPPSAQLQPLVSVGGSGQHHFLQAVARREPRVVHSYMQRQWVDDEAIAWATHGIEAADALAWKELGLTPVEAARQQESDVSPMQTAKAWWEAGVPFDEVADWIGAGLSPREAAEQRAKGVTVERAAVLRSLRKNK